MQRLPTLLARAFLVVALIPLLSLFAVVAHAQDTTVVVDDGGGSGLGVLALAVLTPVVAWISGKLYDGLKTVIPAYDRLPALVHQVAAPLFGFLFGWLSAATGVALITDIAGIEQTWIAGLLNVLLMAGIKRFEKSKAPADATVVLESSRASTGTAPMRSRPRDI